MRKYEIVIIANPDIDEDSLNGIIEKISGWVSDSGGAIEKIDHWGKKQLAFRIQKQRDGQYVLITANMPPHATKELSNNLRFVENILRSMITVVEE